MSECNFIVMFRGLPGNVPATSAVFIRPDTGFILHHSSHPGANSPNFFNMARSSCLSLGLRIGPNARSSSSL